jgi:Tol biopolymer transport system component
MKKYLIVFLFVFAVGCSSGPGISPTESSGIQPTANLAPRQTDIPPVRTPIPKPTFTPTIAPTAIGGGAGRIAFTSERDGYQEIYVMNADGSGLVKLANDISPKYYPAWSPDGKKIAFASNQDGVGSLYVMNADGSNLTELVDTKAFSVYDQFRPELRFDTDCCSPDWSPDGTKIVFMVWHSIGCCYGSAYIHVLNADGSSLASAALPGWSTFDWAPNSQRIAFGSNCQGYFGICVMNADGTNLVNISHKQGGDTYPVWSPDGEKIAFASSRNGDSEVFVMNADGSDQINLTNYGSGWDDYPIWSPDGNKIAFSSYRDGNFEIYVMNVDGSNQFNLTNHPAGDTNPVWSPDGAKITFISDRDGNQ